MDVTIDLKIGKNRNYDSKPTLTVSPEENVGSLRNKIVNTFNLKSFDINRIGLSLVTANEKKNLSSIYSSLSSYNATPGSTIVVKDLGYQVNWRYVYIIEYLGPLIIVLLMFALNGHFNGSNARNMLFIMSSFHYLKRVLESAYVHLFSKPTMPLANLFINCGYYWGLYGLFCGYYLFISKTSGIEDHPLGVLRYFFAFLFFCAEAQNLKCHLILMELKIKNKGDKGIPNGCGFEYVSCANYFWEVVAWICFSLFSNHFSCYIFTACGLFIMSKWALQKHRLYKKTFGDKYPKNRKAIIPFLL
jgi:very-long-chain enoyl-CoA reductase